MVRLTSYDKGNQEILINEEERLLSTKGFIDKDEMYKITRHLAERLFEYEELEQENKFLKSPCCIGDIVFRICGCKGRKYIAPRIVISITFRENNKIEIFTTTTDILGKTVFLTEDEAKIKLKEIYG